MGVASVSAPEIEEILLAEDEIAARVREIGEQISRDYEGKELLLVGILKGAFVFLSDLVRNISIPVSVDFVALSSYGGGTSSSGIVKVTKDVDVNVEGRHVLIIEDIVDTGWTLKMSYLAENLRAGKAASVRVCTLLDKPSRRQVDIELDYVGFVVPNKFVVGYGLDFNGLYRNLPFIGVLKG
ncbi:MAG: hypoxanthine phosphoribosyltransferase [Armatimonadetes bacterium]|nr:hypoxanthine phosphoribosyltransferase [Armatimonadota bacterium]